ncbi:beta-lactamase family protein [Allokutzneria sp. A3M-2-11 16]|uniref:serine hydrolase domain-containing protein n=1 Tax=Allokutzneria sp. A3M-2-11 16 TaxID=2962043 RepID=UPI0020B8C8A6|nr:serine hydrolase domain-containing protein [Allokutzneria sp. A3M-2-11 16]MCP3797893.1 beta-lactamase family protein [Allokutzneria sp. A3M-2-11 16]
MRGYPARIGVVAVLATALTAGVANAGQPGLDPVALQASLTKLHTAGMPAVYAAVRDGARYWQGAAGVSDVDTKVPARATFEHRIGSVTKPMIATAVLQLVATKKIALDAPIGDYLPENVPGELGRRVTVRMLLNHTSGIADFIAPLFPKPADIEANRLREFDVASLVRTALPLPPTGAPGEKWSYSNTNYLIAGLLLTKVTKADFREYVTRNVLRPAGMRNTYFPRREATIRGPHAKAYEELYGAFVPPKDFSVYKMTWADAAGEIIAPMADVVAFHKALQGGKLLPPAQLAEMKRTVPIIAPNGTKVGEYGLGLNAYALPCGRIWGHDGAVWGMGTFSGSTEDGKRQLSVGTNLMKYQRIKPDGSVQPHPTIDPAYLDVVTKAACGSATPPPASALRTTG